CSFEQTNCIVDVGEREELNREFGNRRARPQFAIAFLKNWEETLSHAVVTLALLRGGENIWRGTTKCAQRPQDSHSSPTAFPSSCAYTPTLYLRAVGDDLECRCPRSQSRSRDVIRTYLCF